MQQKIKVKLNTESISKKIGFIFTYFELTNTFETEDKIYHIIVKDDKHKEDLCRKYSNQLIQWINQCPVKKDMEYPSNSYMKDNFGDSQKNIYDEKGNECLYNYDSKDDNKSKKSFKDKIKKLTKSKKKSENEIKYSIDGSKNDLSQRDKKFSHYYNKNKPPIKPQELDLEVIFY